MLCKCFTDQKKQKIFPFSEIAAGFQKRRSTNTSVDCNDTNNGRRMMVSEPYRNYIPSNIAVDSDMEAGPTLPSLETLFDPDLVRNLLPKEKLRQTSILGE